MTTRKSSPAAAGKALRPPARKTARKTARSKNPVARRRAARRGAAAPRGSSTKLGAAGKNQLLLLESNIAELKGDILAVKKPADKAHDAIEKVKKPLKLPGQIKGKVQKVKNVAKGLDSLARLVSLVPGPIGTGAKALHEALTPMIGRNGIFDQVIGALGKLEKAVKPVITKLNQVEKPIDAARSDLAGLLVHVGRLEAIAQTVRGHYGATPPAEVQACLGKLNEGLALVVKPMAAARKRAAKPLADLTAALDKLRAALKPLNDVARDVDKALAQLNSKAVQNMSKFLDKIAKAVKPILDLADWIIRNTIERLLKALGINLDKIRQFFANLVKALNPFKGLQKKIDRIAEDLRKRVADLPAVRTIVGALDQISSLERQLDKAIEKVLRGACRKVLLPDGKAAGRR